MNLIRPTAEIKSILKTFEDRFRTATPNQQARLVKNAKMALQKVRKEFAHDLGEKQLSRSPLEFSRYFPTVHTSTQSALLKKLDQKIQKALERIGRIAT